MKLAVNVCFDNSESAIDVAFRFRNFFFRFFASGGGIFFQADRILFDPFFRVWSILDIKIVDWLVIVSALLITI